MKNIALLLVRLAVGGLMAGHSAQKLFGWFGGAGLKGTSQTTEKLGVTPSAFWGPVAGFGEFSGGVLTALGFLQPIGPQNIMSAMAVATRRAHWGKPIWTSSGGAELPLTNFSVALALVLIGPGKFSLDRLLGVRMPRWLIALTWVNHLAFTGAALFRPEAVQSVFDRAAGSSSAYLGPSDDQPHVEVEQRPRTVETSEQKEQVGI